MSRPPLLTEEGIVRFSNDFLLPRQSKQRGKGQTQSRCRETEFLVRSHGMRLTLGSQPSLLELQPQRQLNQPRIDRSRGDHSEDWRTGVKRLVAHVRTVGWERELRVVEQIEELRTELNALSLADGRRLRDREIGVGLPWTTNDADASVPEVRSVANGYRSAKRRSVEETLHGEVACSAEPVLHASCRGNVSIGFSRTQLSAAGALV